MPELLEFLLNAVVELLSCAADEWAGWRFSLCFLGSIVIALIIEWLLKSSARDVVSAGVTCAGTVCGFIWEIRSKDLG